MLVQVFIVIIFWVNILLDPSRRQQADFLRRELTGEKVDKSESEGNLRGKEDV